MRTSSGCPGAKSYSPQETEARKTVLHAPLWFAALLSAILGCACSGSPDPPNIVLVSIDSLRATNLGCYGYSRNTSPFIDKMAVNGVRFDVAVSTSSWTLPAHAAMFTGLYDSTHGLVDNDQSLDNRLPTLAEILRSQGYKTAGFFGGPYLHPTFGFAQGFDSYQSCMTTTPDQIDGEMVRSLAQQISGPSHHDITGPRTLERVTRWAETAPIQPYFLFIHLWDVHYDYNPPGEYARMFDPDYEGDLTGQGFSTNPRLKPDMPQRDLDHLIALYDGEIRFTDEILRSIFGVLRKHQLIDNTLTVITGDHGEEFFEHGGKGHQQSLYDEVLRVPLIFNWPGWIAGGRVVNQQVRLIDLMPTLARVGGYKGPMLIQGRDLSPLIHGESMATAPALAELLVGRRSVRALRYDGAKVYQFRTDSPAVLFDLINDPAERNPIARSMGRETEIQIAEEDLQTNYQAALALRRSLGIDQGGQTVDLPVEVQDRLESLGYIGN